MTSKDLTVVPFAKLIWMKDKIKKNVHFLHNYLGLILYLYVCKFYAYGLYSNVLFSFRHLINRHREDRKNVESINQLRKILSEEQIYLFIKNL